MPDANLQSGVSARARYRSIVTFVDGDPRSRARLPATIEIARAEDAHLSVMALGYTPNIPSYAFADAVGASMAQVIDQSREDAEASANWAREAIDAATIRGDAFPRAVMYNDVAREAAKIARFADLAVLGPPYGDDVSAAASEILDGVLYDCDVPVMVMPDGATDLDPSVVLIGWDGSRQALKAVKGSLPLLQRAERTEVCIFDPQSDTPGEALATMLARHDVRVEIAALPRPTGSTASALAKRAREIGAGVLVMGAYGHSRFRESVLGGVTRETLEDVSLPLLVAH